MGEGSGNAPGLRTAAPSSADRGMAVAGAPIFHTVKSPAAPRLGHPMVSSAPLPDIPMSRAPHVATPPRPGCPTSRHPTSRTPKSWHPSVPAEAESSSPAGTGGGRAEGHLPIRARWRTSSSRALARPPARPPAGQANCPRDPPRAPRPDWSAGAAARARAPPPHLPRRCPSCLGGGGDAAARRPRPGRASGPEGKGGRAGGRSGGGRGRGPGKCVRSGARGSRSRARGPGPPPPPPGPPGRGAGRAAERRAWAGRAAEKAGRRSAARHIRRAPSLALAPGSRRRGRGAKHGLTGGEGCARDGD